MAPVTKGRGNRFAHSEDGNDREEPVREESPAAYQAHSEAQFASLREQIAVLTGQLSIKNVQDRRRHIPSPHDSEEEDARVENEYGNPFAERGVHRHQPLVQAQANRWESGFKLDIPEFNEGLQPEEFLDWIAAVEEVLDFKGVPEDRRVSLVATKFRGRAAAWWQQLKQSRTRLGKSKINRWEKLLKHMRPAFLPYNYTRTMYQWLHNLSQGSKTVDEYTEEFYKYLTRVELAETDDQLVSRYIGGLRQNIQDSLNLFDPVNVSTAHQRPFYWRKRQPEDPQASLGVAQGAARLATTGRSHLETPPNHQSQTGLQLQPAHLTGVQRRMGLNALSVVNRATELRIATREINMERVYSLTRETPSMSKAMKKSNKPLMTTGTWKKNSLPKIAGLA
jgi:hypothetical protein